MGSVEQTMKNFLYSLFIGLFGIAALTSIAFLLMYAAQSKQQAHLYSDLAAVRKQDTQQEMNCTPFVRQYGILSNKWGVLLCQKEYQTNDIHQNSKNW